MKKHTIAPVGLTTRAGLGHYRPVRIPRGLSPRQVARTIKHPYRADGSLLPLAQRIADANPGLWLGGLPRSEQRARERDYVAWSLGIERERLAAYLRWKRESLRGKRR